jgi:hypothetical protein
MSTVTYMFTCANCRAEFIAPEVIDNSYGLFVMRTEHTDDAACLDAFNDSAFVESYDLVKRNKLVLGLSEERRGEVQQAIFSTTCDPSPTGELFRIGLLPKCPICGFRKMSRWAPAIPPQEWVLPLVEHKAWDAKTLTEKSSLIDQAIRQHLGDGRG